MLVCSIDTCLELFPNADDLASHLIFYHQCLKSSNFKCRQPHCYRTFVQLYSFKRHLVRDHGDHANNLFVAGNNVPVNHVQEEHQNFNGNGLDSDEERILEEEEVLDPRLTLENFINDLYSNIQLYVAQLYAIPSMSRKLVDSIVAGTSALLSTSVRLLKENVFHLLSKGEFLHDNFADEVQKLENMFDALGDPFEAMQTEHQRFRSLTEDGFFIKPEPYELGQVDKYVRVGNDVQLISKIVHGQSVPLGRVLKFYLEREGIFSGIKDYLHKLLNDSSGKVFNFVQGELWKEISARFKNEGKFVLPISVEFDDYEPDNGMGSHQGDHKLGGLYARILCLPPEFQSSLDNMFLLAIFESKYRKLFKNEKAFAPAVKELTFLEQEGISIDVDDGPKQIYFLFSMIVADNLGNNEIQSFVEVFTANYFCRICKLHRTEMHHCRHPVPNNRLRTILNYDQDVALNDSSETGIVENCVWNEVPSYHCAVNYNCEVFHDIFEGTLKYDLCNILHYLVFVREYFSLETLVERIGGFDYGPYENGNKPPTSHITMKRLANSSINMSASEMLCLGRYLGEMVGDLVPEQNGVWRLYLILREIVEIVTCPVFEKGVDLYLETLVKEHHELYLYYFGHLKPKHHFMVHYALLLRRNGPLILLCALMCERNHRRGKLYAHVTNSRVDLALSVALKFQLYLCERLMRPNNFEKVVQCTKKSCVSLETLAYYHSFVPFLQFNPDTVTVAKSVEVFGTKYVVDSVLVVRVGELFPTFGKIVHIIVGDDNTVTFVLRVQHTVSYRQHICAYEIEDADEWVCLNQCDLIYYTPLWHRTAVNDGKTVVSVRHLL